MKTRKPILSNKCDQAAGADDSSSVVENEHSPDSASDRYLPDEREFIDWITSRKAKRKTTSS